jgi:hypothetical protein
LFVNRLLDDCPQRACRVLVIFRHRLAHDTQL